MTAPLIVGVPSAAHREALLRETVGGGQVPVAWGSGGYWWPVSPGAPAAWADVQHALILSHPTDPEAGAMGLARLAWVAPPEGEGMWSAWPDISGQGWTVALGQCERWDPRDLPTLRDATSAAHAIGLTCVHLGLLERVEVLP